MKQIGHELTKCEALQNFRLFFRITVSFKIQTQWENPQRKRLFLFLGRQRSICTVSFKRQGILLSLLCGCQLICFCEKRFTLPIFEFLKLWKNKNFSRSFWKFSKFKLLLPVYSVKSATLHYSNWLFKLDSFCKPYDFWLVIRWMNVYLLSVVRQTVEIA